MKTLVNIQGKIIITVIICMVYFSVYNSIQKHVASKIETPVPIEYQNMSWLQERSIPTLQIDVRTIPLNSMFVASEYVKEAKNHEGDDLSSMVHCSEVIKTNIAGGLDITFYVEDQYGLKTSVTKSFVVE